MKKRWTGIALSICLTAAMLAGCSSSGDGGQSTSGSGSTTASTDSTEVSGNTAAETIELKLGGTSPVGTFHETIANTFAEKVEEVSGGAITIQVNMGGVLGNTMSHYSQLEQGDLDFFMAALDTGSGLREGGDLAVVLVPFLFDDEAHYNRFLRSDLFSGMIGKIEEAHGLKFLDQLSRQLPRGLSTTSVEVKSVDDVNNLKIRTPEATAMTTIWSAWGANPTVIPGGEVYSALQSGLADGQDNDVINTSTSAYYEVQDYYMELDYIYQSLFLWASAKNWDALSAEQQGWITEAVQQTYDTLDQQLQQMYTEEKQKMIDNGVTFVDVDLDSFRSATEAAVGQFDGSLYSAGLYEQIRALAD